MSADTAPGCDVAIVGAKWAGRLARPIEKTIWIAGEAADVEVRTGTVHGAIGSGRRAAKEIARVIE